MTVPPSLCASPALLPTPSTTTARHSGHVRSSRSNHSATHPSQKTCAHRSRVGSRYGSWQMAHSSPSARAFVFFIPAEAPSFANEPSSLARALPPPPPLTPPPPPPTQTSASPGARRTRSPTRSLAHAAPSAACASPTARAAANKTLPLCARYAPAHAALAARPNPAPARKYANQIGAGIAARQRRVACSRRDRRAPVPDEDRGALRRDGDELGDHVRHRARPERGEKRAARKRPRVVRAAAAEFGVFPPERIISMPRVVSRAAVRRFYAADEEERRREEAPQRARAEVERKRDARPELVLGKDAPQDDERNDAQKDHRRRVARRADRSAEATPVRRRRGGGGGRGALVAAFASSSGRCPRGGGGTGGGAAHAAHLTADRFFVPGDRDRFFVPRGVFFSEVAR